MYHSVTIGDKNTYDDWFIVPSSRPLFEAPKPKTKLVDVPGANGQWDLSTALTGYPVFEPREGNWEFYVLNDHGEWSDRYSEIMTYLHGKKLDAILEDDPDWHYTGRFAVDQWKSEKDYSKIVISYIVDPYKYANTQEARTINAGATLNLAGNDYGTAPIIPQIRCFTNAGTQITFVNTYLGINVTKNVTSGIFTFPDIVLYGPQGASFINGGLNPVLLTFQKGSL